MSKSTITEAKIKQQLISGGAAEILAATAAPTIFKFYNNNKVVLSGSEKQGVMAISLASKGTILETLVKKILEQ